MTEEQLGDLVRMLQAQSPLCRLSNMEARTVFELLLQRGYKITVPAESVTKPTFAAGVFSPSVFSGEAGA